MRDRIPEATRAQQRLAALPEVVHAETVALYAAVGHEVPVHEVAAYLRERGVVLAFPRVGDGDLGLFACPGPEALSPGYRGIPEPGPEAPAVAADAIDLFIVPGLLFDRSGRRLGRGAGLYDRLLRRARPDAPRVGFCYADRLVEQIPDEAWDVGMTVIVTECETLRPERVR